MANCDACKELSKVYDGSQELIVTHFINKKNGHPTFLLVQGNWRPESVKIAVNYCPLCGGTVKMVRAPGNGHVHAACDRCGTKVCE